MIRFFLAIIFFMSFISSSICQHWFDDEQTWVYRTGEWAYIGYSVMTKKDSFIQDDQLIYEMEVYSNGVDQQDWMNSEWTSSIFTYEKNNQIFVKEEESDEYVLQYDFNLEVGDSIVYAGNYDDYGCASRVVYYLDSLSTIELGGKTMTQQHFHFVDTSTSYETGESYVYESNTNVVEGIGATNRGIFRLSNSHPCYLDAGSGILCSFSYNQDELSFLDIDCFDLPSSIDDEETSKIRVYPNPSFNILFLEGINTLNLINIYNSNGTLVYSNLDCCELDISGLLPGIYLLELKTKEAKSSWHKFVKQD